MKNEAFFSFYEQLLAQRYTIERGGEEKPIWEWIAQRELTVAPHFVGHAYENSESKIMIVGRAVNGWDVDFEKCTSLDNTVRMALEEDSRFDDVVNEDGIEYEDVNTGEKKRYYYSRSAFWRLIREVLQQYGESDNWHQKIVWSNLYKIAPYVTGNPDWRLVKPNLQTYIDCICAEIKEFCPHKVLFITGMDYLQPYKGLPSFLDALGISEVRSNDFILGTGKYEGANLVVCVRPERKSAETIATMAKYIKTALGD